MRDSEQSTISWNYLETERLPKGAVAALRVLFEGQWPRLVAAAFFYLVKHSPVWIAPILSAQIINLIVEAVNGGPGSPALAGALGQGAFLGVLIALFYVQNIPSAVLYARFMNAGVRAMEARTRMSLIRRLQQLSFGYYDQARTGALQTKVLRDVENVGTMVNQFVNTILAGLITLVIAMSYTLGRKPVMVLFFLLTTPLAVSVIHLFRKTINENTQNYRSALEGMTVKVNEMITMLPITRAHAVESYETERLDEAMQKVALTGRKQDIFNTLFGATTWVIFQLFGLSALLFSGWMAVRGEIPLGDVVLYQGFFASIVAAVSGMMNVLPELTKGVNSIHSIGEVLRSPDVEANEGKTSLGDFRGEIVFKNVAFSYPSSKREVLSDLSFTAEAGKSLAFVGESGSGKSTVMNLILGFHRPSSGSICLDGRDLSTLDMRTVRKNLSVVSQNVILFSGTIRDNVTYGRDDLGEEEVRRALEAANALAFIEALPDGLDTRLGEHGSRLSGGQRQRLAIARALIRDPRLIILDEATSALDVESERLVQEALERLVADRTTFIVAHRLSTIRNADRIAVLKHGRLVETGTHDELLGLGGEFARLRGLYS